MSSNSSQGNRLRRFFASRSIRFRLTALFVTIFGTTLIVYSALLYRAFVRTHQLEFDTALFNYAVDVSDAIDVDFFGDLSVRPDILSRTSKILPFSLGRAYLQILDLGGKVLARSGTLGNNQLPLTPQDRQELIRRGASFSTLDARRLPRLARDRPSEYRLVSFLIDKPGLPKLILQIAVPLSILERERLGLLTFILITLPLILVIATLGGLYLSRRALAPIRAIITTAGGIGATQLSERLPVPEADDEIRKLAETLNGLLDRLQLAFESQERFVSDASHQLKTPLSILRGELDVVRSRARSPEEIGQFLASASQEIDYLTRMVEDLLLLARMDAGKGSLNIQVARLDEVAVETVARLEPIATRKKSRLRVNLQESSADAPNPYEVNGDPDLLQAMLHNLIENAIKYSPEGGMIEVSVEDHPSSVTASVKDQGPGIPLEAQARVFQRFYRVESLKNTAPGVGLGLPIARRIAEVHGGEISVESGPEGGTTFRIRIGKA